MAVTIGSLFSGIGGLELGLERAGLGPVIWQAERDPFCRRVLAKHWPGVTRYDDVRDIDETAERPELICGGFPCQDISHAGQKAGLAGARSGLWDEFLRIIRELRPAIIVVENVAALLIRGLDRVLGDLATSGYDAQWDCIPAVAFGAHHQRDRVFIVAYPRGIGRGERAPHFAVAAKVTRTADGGAGVAGPGAQIQGRVPGRIFGAIPTADPVWAVEPSVDRVADGVPDRVGRYRALGNAVVPQVAEHIGRCIVQMLASK